MFGYWWNKSRPTSDNSNTPARLADAPALQQAIGYLKRNVGHKVLVEANFRAFRQFSEQLTQHQIRLIVIEGQVHPDARRACDTDGMQQTTRQRLTELAVEHRFTFVPSADLPEFSAADFADAYHLNPTGRRKLSSFLAACLIKLTD
ncbi:MAG: hypothetical protein RIK87_16845 [Fuerstiella sp.]